MDIPLRIIKLPTEEILDDFGLFEKMPENFDIDFIVSSK